MNLALFFGVVAVFVAGYQVAVLRRTRADIRDVHSKLTSLKAKRWSDLKGVIYALLTLVLLYLLSRT
ncbi:hypothetical protein J4573_44405 [Actinomadura barringtoniae]|uniref:Uncharacterized protein n=1 Tax=Actinomadura barringtoniae TaxID=1427535 RepID=A0A939TFB6_9ACTN|nr:hypothetical protein [Actinomadura barringtoniae]MBO2454195.1 hypothetical protein [Actinomadura barringtoniae]